MTWGIAIAGLVTAFVLPFVIALIKRNQWSDNTKRWIAVIVTVLVGIAAGYIFGIPTPDTLAMFVVAIYGAMNMAYALFKSLGITVKWLDALSDLGSVKEEEPKAPEDVSDAPEVKRE